MAKWRKKPVVVEAERWWPGQEHVAVTRVMEFMSPCEQCGRPLSDHGWIKTLEGEHRVCPGDWIIRGLAGEYYPCKPDIFAATYEPVEEAS